MRRSKGLPQREAPGALPRSDGDLFDRMLEAQAQIEGVPILTADPAISRDGVATNW